VTVSVASSDNPVSKASTQHSTRGTDLRPSRRRFAMVAALLLVALVLPSASTTAADLMPVTRTAIAQNDRTVRVSGATTGFYGSGIAADTKANMMIGPVPAVAHGFKAVTSSALTTIRFSQRGGTDYSHGTGGTLKISVRPDTNGHPASTILASMTFKPGNPAGGWTTYKAYTFPSPATLTAGRKYYIVFQNVDAAPTKNYISINNLAVLRNITTPRQPAFGDSDYVVLSGARGAWDVEPHYTAVMDLTYANGKHNGQAYIEAMLAQYGVISGPAKQVRETFVISGGDRSVTTASVRVRRTGGASQLLVNLETSTGGFIDSVAVPAKAIPLSSQGTIGSEVWVTVKFVRPHILKNGVRYQLRLWTYSGTTYTTIPIREGTDAGFVSHRFTDGSGQRTVDGSNWSNLYKWSPVDLQFYFR
jgi:hypothetical protein